VQLEVDPVRPSIDPLSSGYDGLPEMRMASGPARDILAIVDDAGGFRALSNACGGGPGGTRASRIRGIFLRGRPS